MAVRAVVMAFDLALLGVEAAHQTEIQLAKR